MAEGYVWATENGKRAANGVACATGDVVEVHAAAANNCVIVAVGDDGVVWVRIVKADEVVHEYRQGI